METGHVEQHAQFSVLLDELFKLRHETFVVCLGQNPADVNGQKISSRQFIDVNRHFGDL